MKRTDKKKPLQALEQIIYKLGWKCLEGWARNYYANPHDGKIYSVAKKNGKLRVLNGNKKAGSNGYISVKLKGLDGKYHTKSEHRIMCDTFIPNPEKKRVSHHKNHDRTDNRQENLEWVTHRENSRRRKDNEK